MTVLAALLFVAAFVLFLLAHFVPGRFTPALGLAVLTAGFIVQFASTGQHHTF